MASPYNPDRWTFEFHTPLGTTRCSYEVRDAELVFQSDDPLAGGSESVRWDRVAEGGTAAMAGMDGRGGPDLPEWVAGRARKAGAVRVGAAPGFMHPLPQRDQRDALVAAVRSQLGLRWIGEWMPLPQAQQRLGISSRNWSGLQVFGIVVGVLVLLALSIMLLGLLTTPVFFLPLGLVAGGWLVRKGLRGRRDSLAAATVPFADAGHARSGLVRLEARAVATAPLTTPVTGRASAWWDAAVDVWYEGPDESGGWRQMTARFAGSVETLELETVAGGITVWLNDAATVAGAAPMGIRQGHTAGAGSGVARVAGVSVERASADAGARAVRGSGCECLRARHAGQASRYTGAQDRIGMAWNPSRSSNRSVAAKRDCSYAYSAPATGRRLHRIHGHADRPRDIA